MKARTMSFTARVGVALGVIALVVAANQVSSRSPRVLGTKLSRCTVGGVVVPLGTTAIRAEGLSVSIAKGKVVSVLVPPLKLGRGKAQRAAPAVIAIGVRGAKPGFVNATVSVSNASSCPVAFTGVQISARPNASVVESVSVSFGGRDRVVVQPGRHATGRVLIPARTDGIWTVDANATADVGAA